MNDNRIATVGDLIAALGRLRPRHARPDRHRIRLTRWTTRSGLSCAPRTTPTATATLPQPTLPWCGGRGETYGCLPDSAADALGWS